MVRAKFRVTTITLSEYNIGAKKIQMVPVQGEPFGRWTPSGMIDMTVINEEAAEQFVLGKEYYVDFTQVVENEEENQ